VLSIGAAAYALFTSCCGAPLSDSIEILPLSSLDSAASIGIYLDRPGAIMFAVVALIGFVVIRFSDRYLNGEARQVDFLRWLTIAVSAVQVLVLSGDLVMFFLAWIVVNVGLHKLLLFYPARPGALACARKKFVASRIGDCAVLAALVLIYRTYGTLDFQALFERVEALRETSLIHEQALPLQVIAFLLGLGAIIKSAQFPFHSWLPDSLETPTPVSALMHAGIINAGGFFLIRMSPIMQAAPIANGLIAIIGALTALYGMSVMVTQPTIKKRLAYSTVGQMGFMIMQCGLGLYALALLHIVAHAFYKAYAFLRAGSAMDQAREQRFFPARTSPSPIIALLLVAVMGVGFLRFAAPPFTMNYVPVLVAWTIAVIHIFLGAAAARRGRAASLFSAAVMTTAMVGFYSLLSVAFSRHLATTLPTPGAAPLWAGMASSAILIFGFVIQFAGASLVSSPSGQRLFIHLHNGFYIGAYADRLINRMWPNSRAASTQGASPDNAHRGAVC